MCIRDRYCIVRIFLLRPKNLFFKTYHTFTGVLFLKHRCDDVIRENLLLNIILQRSSMLLPLVAGEECMATLIASKGCVIEFNKINKEYVTGKHKRNVFFKSTTTNADSLIRYISYL